MADLYPPRRFPVVQLADFCYRKRRYVLLAWVLVFVAVMAAGGALPAEHRANYQTPGAESTKAYDLLADRFPARKGDSVKIVFAGNIDAPASRTAIDAVIATAKAQPFVAGVVSPYAPEGATQVSRGRSGGYPEGQVDRPLDQLLNADPQGQKHFLDAINPGPRDGVDVEVATFVAAQALGS